MVLRLHVRYTGLRKQENESRNLKDIKKGEIIYKYGCKIGYALKDIKAGEHVHTSNLDSKMI